MSKLTNDTHKLTLIDLTESLKKSVSSKDSTKIIADRSKYILKEIYNRSLLFKLTDVQFIPSFTGIIYYYDKDMSKQSLMTRAERVIMDGDINKFGIHNMFINTDNKGNYIENIISSFISTTDKLLVEFINTNKIQLKLFEPISIITAISSPFIRQSDDGTWSTYISFEQVIK